MYQELEHFRPGILGALMDEYEYTGMQITELLAGISEEQFTYIADPDTKDPDCHSIQTIMKHVIGSGYGYANYLRTAFWGEIKEIERPKFNAENIEGVRSSFAEMMRYTIQTLHEKWTMTDEEIQKISIRTRWNVVYDPEQLLEHAIVHILRHRRQMNRFLLIMEAKGIYRKL